MRIFERLRERQSQGFIELDPEMEVAPVKANPVRDNDYPPAKAIGAVHTAGTPQTSNGHA